jgi:hypothetical protein
MGEESCEGFEIAIEMRRHGAGEAEALARLARHLDGCASCRGFDRLGAESEGRLRADAESALASTNLERLRARGLRLALSRWNDVGAFYLFIGLALFVKTSLRAAGVVPGEASLMDWSLALMWVAAPFVEIRRRRRAIEEAFRSDVLLFEMRTDVHQRLITAGAFIVFALGLVAFLAADRLLDRGSSPGGAMNLAFSAGLAALSTYVAAVRIPALLRERREIPEVRDPYAGIF